MSKVAPVLSNFKQTRWRDTNLWHAVGISPPVPNATQTSLQRLQMALLFHLTCHPFNPQKCIRSLIRCTSVIEVHSGACLCPTCPITFSSNTWVLLIVHRHLQAAEKPSFLSKGFQPSLTIDTWICQGVTPISVVSSIHHHLL